MAKCFNINELPSRILDQIEFEVNSGCWLWNGRLHKGYAALDSKGDNQRSITVLVHRMFYEMYVGGVNQDLHHICRTKSCVNPAHLVQIPHDQHMHLHLPTPRTHCAKGHEYVEGSFSWLKGSKGWERRCRICYRERARKSWYKLHG